MPERQAALMPQRATLPRVTEDYVRNQPVPVLNQRGIRRAAQPARSAAARSSPTIASGSSRGVDRRAGDEHVGPGLRAALDGLQRDPAVHLQPDLEAGCGDQLAGAPDLGQAEVEELLAAEARLHGHHQEHVELAEHVGERLDRGVRLERHPGPGTLGTQLAGEPHRRLRGLGVEGHRAGTCFGVRRCPAVRVLDHQVRVQRQVGRLREALEDRQPEGQVGHEVVVHHVDVHPVGARDPADLVGQAGQVGVEDARRDLDTHGGSILGSRRRPAAGAAP